MEKLSFSGIIKFKRKEKGWSMAALAREIGYSTPYVMSLEHGSKHLQGSMLLQRLRKALDIKYDILLGKAALSNGIKTMGVLPLDEQEAIVSFYALCVNHGVSAKKGLRKVSKYLK